MLYATYLSNLRKMNLSGHIGDGFFADQLNEIYHKVEEIQADGDELERCCAILGRNLPPNRVYTFFGDNAKEIAMNWRK